jgi:hypothetical protein
VVTGTTISSTVQNNTTSDIATALTNSIAKNGETTPTANLPMGGYKHTGVAVAASTTDYSRADQVQNSTLTYLTSVSGADTITATAAISLAAYATGQKFHFISAGANTGAATLNINGIGAKSITKNGATALAAGDIPTSAIVTVSYDGTQFQLLNMKRGTAAAYDVGTSANNVVQLDGSAKLPAVDGSQLTNIGKQLQPISASVAANALTISASALSLDFRSTTLGDGTVTRVSGTPSNLVISSGSTLGTLSGVASTIAVLAMNNAGTIELAAVNLNGGANTLTESGVISTTAEGGAGAADSASVIYSTTARTSVAYRVVGYVTSTQATAGTWATAPSVIQGAGGYVAIKSASQITSTARVATSSGTEVTWTGIPAWAREITVMMMGVSTNGTSPYRLRVGAGSTQTTGYASVGTVIGQGNTASTGGFDFYQIAAADAVVGKFVLTRADSDIWVCTCQYELEAAGGSSAGLVAGRVTLTAAFLDRVIFTTVNGTDAFDAGSVTLVYQ